MTALFDPSVTHTLTLLRRAKLSLSRSAGEGLIPPPSARLSPFRPRLPR
jgi:hypothetical protein